MPEPLDHIIIADKNSSRFILIKCFENFKPKQSLLTTNFGLIWINGRFSL